MTTPSIGTLQPRTRGLTQRDFRHASTLPAVNPNPPPFSVSAAGASSTITNAVQVTPSRPGAFTITGAQMVGSILAGNQEALTSYGGTTGPQASPAPFAVEFVLDTVLGTIEIEMQDLSNQRSRLAIDGQYISLGSTFVAPGNSGNFFYGIVNGLSAGRHTFHLEMGPGGQFMGVNVGQADTVRAVPKPPLRIYAFGDSVFEPTISEALPTVYPTWGIPQMLGQILGCEVRSSGSGGTGYINVGSSGRVAFITRMVADMQNPDVIIWGGGYNDLTQTAAAVQAAAAACFQLAQATWPNVQQFALSPWTATGAEFIASTSWAIRDAIQAAAVANGVTFIDLTNLAVEQYATPAGTLTASATAGGNQITSTAELNANGNSKTYVRIGSGATQEVHQMILASGSGPYVLQLNSGVLANNHSIGEPVVQVGGAYVTGNGTQATRTVTDGVINGTTAYTSATAAFNATKDTGGAIIGTGIPGGTYIKTVSSSTAVVMTQAATASASSVSTQIVSGTAGNGTADRFVGTSVPHPTVAGSINDAYTIAHAVIGVLPV